MSQPADKDESASRQSAEDLVPERDGRLAGWGGNEGPELSTEQVTQLQEHDEPVADADFGGLLTGDLGRPATAHASDAPETVEPDTSLGHEGGKRYETFAGDGGESA